MKKLFIAVCALLSISSFSQEFELIYEETNFENSSNRYQVPGSHYKHNSGELDLTIELGIIQTIIQMDLSDTVDLHNYDSIQVRYNLEFDNSYASVFLRETGNINFTSVVPTQFQPSPILAIGAQQLFDTKSIIVGNGKDSIIRSAIINPTNSPNTIFEIYDGGSQFSLGSFSGWTVQEIAPQYCYDLHSDPNSALACISDVEQTYYAFLDQLSLQLTLSDLKIYGVEKVTGLNLNETSADATLIGRYDLQGREISFPSNQIFIEKYSDGTSKRVFVE